jgi:hypothetical protein
MTERVLIPGNCDFDQQHWLNTVSTEVVLLDLELDLQRYALRLPLSRMELILQGIVNCNFNEAVRIKFRDLCVYRNNKKLAGQAWALFQDNLDNRLLFDFCLRSRQAWNGLDLSGISKSCLRKNAYTDNIISRWFKRLAADTPENQIPDWVKLLDSLNEGEEMRQGHLDFGISISNCIFEKLINKSGGSPDYSLAQFMNEYELSEKSALTYELLSLLCTNSDYSSLIIEASDLVALNILPWSEQSGSLFSSYLQVLSPAHYANQLCSDVSGSVSQDLLQRDLDSDALDKFFRWQRRYLVEQELVWHEFKLGALRNYFDDIRDVKIDNKIDTNSEVEPEKNYREMLIFFDNIVVYDSTEYANEMLIFPMKLFRKNEQQMDIFEQIEARQAVLKEENEQRYSDSLIKSVREGNGSQSLRLKFVRGAALLYAKEVLEDLLG